MEMQTGWGKHTTRPVHFPLGAVGCEQARQGSSYNFIPSALVPRLGTSTGRVVEDEKLWIVLNEVICTTVLISRFNVIGRIPAVQYRHIYARTKRDRDVCNVRLTFNRSSAPSIPDTTL
jgi:hypothetical protein